MEHLLFRSEIDALPSRACAGNDEEEEELVWDEAAHGRVVPILAAPRDAAAASAPPALFLVAVGKAAAGAVAAHCGGVARLAAQRSAVLHVPGLAAGANAFDDGPWNAGVALSHLADGIVLASAVLDEASGDGTWDDALAAALLQTAGVDGAEPAGCHVAVLTTVTPLAGQEPVVHAVAAGGPPDATAPFAALEQPAVVTGLAAALASKCVARRVGASVFVLPVADVDVDSSTLAAFRPVLDALSPAAAGPLCGDDMPSQEALRALADRLRKPRATGQVYN